MYHSFAHLSNILEPTLNCSIPSPKCGGLGSALVCRPIAFCIICLYLVLYCLIFMKEISETNLSGKKYNLFKNHWVYILQVMF